MITVTNMPGGSLGEANRKVAEGRGKKGWRREYRANAKHGVGVLKDRFIEILMTEDPFARK
jgi:hypothetical protein